VSDTVYSSHDRVFILLPHIPIALPAVVRTYYLIVCALIRVHTEALSGLTSSLAVLLFFSFFYPLPSLSPPLLINVPQS
jgi:hypothetical protein